MFTKKERGTFKYHFAHWASFQMTALNLKVWKPHMLFHDWYKPWMKLFCQYKTVQQYHRTHSKHHLEYLIMHPDKEDKMNWLDMVIDWECSRFTKAEAQMTAYETYLYELKAYSSDQMETNSEDKNHFIKVCLIKHVGPLLKELKLYPSIRKE